MRDEELGVHPRGGDSGSLELAFHLTDDAEGRSTRRRLERAPALLARQCVRKGVQLAAEHPFEPVLREFDAMVGDAIFGKLYVRIFSERSPPADLRAPLCGELGFLALGAPLEQARTEDAQGFRLVLKL